MLKKVAIVLLIATIIIFLNSGVFNEIKYIIEDRILNEEIEDINNSEEDTKIENFYNISIGDSKDSVFNKIGNPSRIDKSEYSFNWCVYNQYEGKFAMVGIDNNSVVALFSNSINSCEMENIKLDDNKANINNNYQPLEYRLKGNTRYIIDSNGEYDIIKVNNKYITVFYDVIAGNKVCSYQIINQETEDNMKDVYAVKSEELRKSFELQMIDLINSTRTKYKLGTLKFNEQATESSRKHSKDML